MSEGLSTRTAIVPRVQAGWKTLPRIQNILVWPVAAVLGYMSGASLVTDPRLAKVLVLVPLLVLALAIRPEKLFVAWLFAAPLIQGASNGTHRGHALFKFVFLVPPLVMLVRMAAGSVRNRGLWAIDALPALYLGYIFVSARLLPSTFASRDATTPKAIYIAVGVAILVYYVTAFATTSDRFPELVAASFLWSSVVVAALALVDGLTGWNPWHNVVASSSDHVRRAVSTFSSPEALGAYLGVGVAFAVAILAWKGPRSLRLPAMLVLGLSMPAFYLTYTRGPVFAIAAVCVLMVAIAKRTRWASLIGFVAAGTLLFASWSQLSSTTIYKNRLGNAKTVTPRLVLSDVSLKLFRERPVFGHGYGTFDQVKLTVPVNTAADAEIVATTTSHDTYLTVLVESGVVGLCLLVFPWIVIGWRSIAAAWRGSIEPWVVAGCVGGAAAYALAAVTYDSRFFPLTSALPWITLGVVRKVLAERETRAPLA
jgi:O-antigen ligase